MSILYNIDSTSYKRWTEINYSDESLTLDQMAQNMYDLIYGHNSWLKEQLKGSILLDVFAEKQ